MARTSWPLLALLGIVLPAGLAWCQELGPASPAPAPEALPAPAPEAQPRPPAYILPPHYQLPAIEPIVDPVLDDSPGPPPGFFANVELFLLRPHLNSALTGNVNQGLDTVALTTQGPLGTTVSPTFELGYRLPKQRGEFMVAYRFEAIERNHVPDDVLGGLSQRDRLNMNLIDLDWSNHHPFALGLGWDLRFNIGVRVLTLYFDTARNFGPLGNPSGQTNEHATSSLAGAGPEAGVELSRELYFPGLVVVGRIAGAAIFSNIHQSFTETTTPAAGAVVATNRVGDQVENPMLTIEAGLGYSPPGWNCSRFTLGYIWEELWQVGRLNNSNGNLLNRGLFFRAEWNF
jgi:hypothetical protein